MLKINESEFRKFKQSLNQQLFNAVAVEGVDAVRSVTPIKFKRLHNSARAENPEIDGNLISCEIRLGGVRLRGETGEVGIFRDVDYALQREHYDPFLSNNLQFFADAIVDGLMR